MFKYLDSFIKEIDSNDIVFYADFSKDPSINFAIVKIIKMESIE